MIVPTLKKVSPLIAYMSNNDIESELIRASLSVSETKRYTHLPFKKQKQWILGRMAGKQAIVECSQSRFGVIVPYYTIEIISWKFNRPSFRILSPSKTNGVNRKMIEQSLNFSISHSGEHAVASAAMTSKEGYIGVDIERIRSLKTDVIEAFMTSYEHIKYMKKNTRDRTIYSIFLWSAKEAYLKAIGRGLLTHPRRVEIDDDLTPGSWSIKVDGQNIDALTTWKTSLDKKYIITQVLIPQ